MTAADWQRFERVLSPEDRRSAVDHQRLSELSLKTTRTKRS